MQTLITILPDLNQLIPSLIAQYGNWIYIGLFAVVFIETGVVVMPFLPGDSLLFLCGSLAALGSSLDIWLLLGLLGLAAILGDFVNFKIGQHFGSYLTNTTKFRRFIKPEYLEQSKTFFRKHGKIAIFLGRFMPIIRTFVPFTAGISRMHYGSFVLYNVLGGMSWVSVAVCAGYFFGNIPFVKVHFEFIMIVIIVISLLPAAIMAIRRRKAPIHEK